MMSNPHSNFHERHRQHRRQISTPSAIEAAKAPNLPAPALKRFHAHRRGQSLDHRSLQMQPQSVQDGTFSFTNAAVHQQPQHFLREAQRQQFSRQTHPAFPQHMTPMSLMSGCQALSQEDLQALTNRNGNDTTHPNNMAFMNPAMMNVGNQNFGGHQPTSVTLNMIQQHRNANLPGNNAIDRPFLDNHIWDAYQQDNMAMPQQQTNGITAEMRRMSAQSDIGPSRAQRPHTPKQANTHYMPITPATTPFKRTMNMAKYNQDTQVSPTKEQSLSMSGSAQASYMQRAKSLQGVPGTTTTQKKIDLPSPPNTASFEIDSFDAFDCKQESSFDNLESQNVSQDLYPPSLSTSSSFYSSPELAAMQSSEDASDKAPKVPIVPATPQRAHHQRMSSETSTASATKPKLSPRVASIDNLNLDARVHASIKQTGVTIDEIAAFIHGPDPVDGKWVCLHSGCGRRFGRKENIKSHVQTHLGDRQYKCDHCEKCFVRGHDLKRHAKIHTGDKPYECLCGNVFARHDALTRHRQRGMCIGGYKGIVRKTTKRGRPKKHRPELEDRQDKASRTRQRAAEKSSSESFSGSDSARSSPPSEVFENMSIRGSSPAQDIPVFNTPNYSLPPEAFTFTPPASPGCSTGNKPSPNRTHRSLTPNSEDEILPTSLASRPLDRIVEETELPFISEPETCPYTSSAANSLSSPHTAPTLADSSNGSDLDIFINQDATTGFGKHEFPGLTDPDMASFPEYVNPASFDSGLDLFPGKTFSTGPSMNDDFFSFQFQVDEQPSDLMARDFFLE
ncbi:hypothetical protein ASPWEDRAFT_49291 [Aspergillus wentii DTO 134E9]|uniref:C2H2-type domain-containing protein n=1 Tax=Aspergillus wentii DTO 134E9 TaxID=1073089 RepID=A0A1L9RWN9_ASPWE|nr:uncharacterized protein ASPWEDRAFT_49291 [Aspergillus wentii DTO 134E9]OJJ39258.1 hypothetical protein ASPWEDRAFT_49291 [Aspergillus wentii DTO 134E9]